MEAIGVLEWDRREIDLLSVGCTTSPLTRMASPVCAAWATTKPAKRSPKVRETFLAQAAERFKPFRILPNPDTTNA